MAQQKNTDYTNTFGIIEQFEMELLYRLEIGVDNGFCTMPDGKTVLKIDDKPICYPKNAFVNPSVVGFDPFFNRKLAYALFSMYTTILVKEKIASNLIIDNFFITSDVMVSGANKLLAVCRGRLGNTPIEWSSNRFRNETVCWMDLLFKMDNSEQLYSVMRTIDDAIDYVRSVEAL